MFLHKPRESRCRAAGLGAVIRCGPHALIEQRPTFHANVVLGTGREKSRCASPAGGDGKWQGAVDEPGKQVLADDALPVPVSKSAASRPVPDITSDGPSQQTDAGHVPLKSVGCGAKVVTCGCGLRAGGWVALLALVAPCAAWSKEGSETVSLDKGPGGADPGRLEWRYEYSVEGRSDGALTGANVKQTLSKPNGRAFPRKASMPSPRFRSPSARCLSARVPFTCAGRHGRRHLQLLLRTSGLCRSLPVCWLRRGPCGCAAGRRTNLLLEDPVVLELDRHRWK